MSGTGIGTVDRNERRILWLINVCSFPLPTKKSFLSNTYTNINIFAGFFLVVVGIYFRSLAVSKSITDRDFIHKIFNHPHYVLKNKIDHKKRTNEIFAFYFCLFTKTKTNVPKSLMPRSEIAGYLKISVCEVGKWIKNRTKFLISRIGGT